MRLTPLDIRGQQFKRVMRGLDAEEIEAFLTTVANEFEALVSENKELRSRVVELEAKVGEYRSMEKALRDTLLTAEKVMGDAKEGAQREAALIIREAELQAERATARISQDLADLRRELVELRRVKDAYLSRVRWLLRSHLELIEGHAQDFADFDVEVRPGSQDPAAHAGSERPGTSVPGPYDWPERGDAALLNAPLRVAPPPAVPPPSQAPPAAVPQQKPPVWPERPHFDGGGLTPADNLSDVLRPIAPDGSYAAPPVVTPGGAASALELAESARRAERLAAEARATLERHAGWPEAAAPNPAGPKDPAGPRDPAGPNEAESDGRWSMDRFKDGLRDGDGLPRAPHEEKA
jgi:cell division initiation protein